jgi:hypothetical protein
MMVAALCAVLRCAMQVLYALPWLLTGSILAHEAMHAWLRLSGYRRLPQQVEEGMCQLMALLWLERQQPQQVGVGLCKEWVGLWRASALPLWAASLLAWQLL